jgi:hypothetical protein
MSSPRCLKSWIIETKVQLEDLCCLYSFLKRELEKGGCSGSLGGPCAMKNVDYRGVDQRSKLNDVSQTDASENLSAL